MTNSSNLTGVLVGCGGISRAWLAALTAHPTFRLVGLVDLDPAQIQARQADFDLADLATGSDLDQMLDDQQPDIVFDCTVPTAHTTVTLTALAHGCHVLGEKPLAVSMAKAQQMIDAAQASGKIYAVMQNRRYLDDIIRLRNFLQRGDIGPLTTLNADFYIGAHFGGFRDEMAHVLVLDMAIHTFDQARFIAGAAPVSVYCHEWNPQGSWYRQDASAVAIFEMSNGLVFTYRGSWCAEGLRTTWESDWRAVGTRGSVTWNGGEHFAAEVVSSEEGFLRETQPVDVPLLPPLAQTGHAGCIYDFIDAVATGRTPQTVCTDNIQSLAMVHGAIASAEQGRKIDLSASAR